MHARLRDRHRQHVAATAIAILRVEIAQQQTS